MCAKGGLVTWMSKTCLEMPRSKTMEQKRADWRKNKLQQSVNPKNLMCRAFESNFVLGQH